jgi:hypothetical protein
MPNINCRKSEGEVKLKLLSYKNFVTIYQILCQCPISAVVIALAIYAGDRGLIPCMGKQIFKFSLIPSPSSGVTKPSSLTLATSEITSPSKAQRGES